ncbi:hypothetical protein R3P38DRAFT_2794639 [Favolaschia claudopus]|uniref:Uncharacterized protein n=1 Tax=Favolaschia claudopus TaxID=2862362 RepID=A0AAW0A8K9_9AGAR
MINLLAEQHAQAVKLRLPRRQPRPGPLVVELLRVLLVTKKREDSHLSHALALPAGTTSSPVSYAPPRASGSREGTGSSQAIQPSGSRSGAARADTGGDDSDESRSPNRAHHAANQLARLLAQDTAMASPGPRRRNFVPLAHALESSDSDELPVVIRSRRRALPVPDEDAENPDEIYSLNDTGSDSDEDGSPSPLRSAAQPAPQRAMRGRQQAPVPSRQRRAAGSRTQRAAAATHSQGTDTPPLQQEMVIRTSKDNEGFVWMNEESLTALALKKDRSADCKHFYAQREEVCGQPLPVLFKLTRYSWESMLAYYTATRREHRKDLAELAWFALRRASGFFVRFAAFSLLDASEGVAEEDPPAPAKLVNIVT